MKKIGTIAHIDHSKTSLTAAIVRLLAHGVDVQRIKPVRPTHMPDDIVVVRNRDADEAGDYRLARHGDVVDDPQWEITDIPPSDLD